jgi:hypothetical protein
MAIALKPITITAATTLSRNRHAGAVVNVNNTTGFAVTLPAATGTGDVYTLFYVATVSSGNHTVVRAGSDVIIGGVGLSTDIAGTAMIAGSTTATITMNGSTTGGVVGSWLQFTDASSGKWLLNGFLCCTGTEATPFS